MKFIRSGEFREIAALAIPFLTLVGFIINTHTQRGVDDWGWYFLALVLTIFLPKRFLPLVLAPVFSILTLAGYSLSPSPIVDDHLALINCLMGIGVLWITAAIIFFRKRLEAAWQKSELQYRFLFKNIQAGFAHCQMIFEREKPVDFIYLSVNPAFQQITGLNEVVGKRATEVIPDIQKTQPELIETYGRVAAGGQPRRFEYYLESARVWLNVSVYCPAKGYFVTTFENITERKRAENESILFRALIDRSSEGIDVVDPDTGYFRDINETSCRRLGYTREELLSLRVSDIDTSVSQATWPDLVRDLRQRRFLLTEGCQRRKDGSTYPVELSIRWVELEREYIVTVVRDITDRKQAEQSIKKNQEQLRSFVEQAPLSIAMFDRQMRYIITSRRWISEYGGGSENLAGRSHYELNPDLPEQWKQIHRRALAGEFLKNDEDRWVHGDGHITWLRWAVHPWRDAHGKVGGVIISSEDITERKKAENEARQSEERLLMVTENARVGLVMLSREHRYLFANAAYFQILGLSPDIIGKRLEDVLGTVYEEQVRPNLEAAFQGKRVSYEMRKPLDGEDHFYAVKYEPTIESGTVLQVVVVITDITEQKRANAEIQNQLDELRRWHAVMLDREDRILGLKQEVNELLAGQSVPRRYSELKEV